MLSLIHIPPIYRHFQEDQTKPNFSKATHCKNILRAVRYGYHYSLQLLLEISFDMLNVLTKGNTHIPWLYAA